ncbi:MAG: hypothetical protein AB1816_08125 [Bacillota bacterium]
MALAPVAGRMLGELAAALWGVELDRQVARDLRRLFVKGVNPWDFGLGESPEEAWCNLAHALGRAVLDGTGLCSDDGMRCELVVHGDIDWARFLVLWWPRGRGACPGLVLFACSVDEAFMRFRSLGAVEEWLGWAADQVQFALVAAGWLMPAGTGEVCCGEVCVPAVRAV